MFLCYIFHYMDTQLKNMSGKEYFLDHLVREKLSEGKQNIKILELGCGTAHYAPGIITRHKEVEYTGVEPFLKSFQQAEKYLEHVERATVYHQLGYDEVAGLEDSSFDVVLSLSVLEHVKQLERFIALGARYAKKGALVVHRYDLGHALYPGSLKEKFQVFLGNTFPSVLPEHKFVRYVPMNEVAELFKAHHNSEPFKYTFHQMPNAKRLDSAIRKSKLDDSSLLELCEWELKHSKTFEQLPVSTRERLFPTVAVWGHHS